MSVLFALQARAAALLFLPDVITSRQTSFFYSGGPPIQVKPVQELCHIVMSHSGQTANGLRFQKCIVLHNLQNCEFLCHLSWLPCDMASCWPLFVWDCLDYTDAPAAARFCSASWGQGGTHCCSTCVHNHMLRFADGPWCLPAFALLCLPFLPSLRLAPD